MLILTPARRNDTVTLVLFVLTVFVGASVLFVVEPMVGKMLLPLAGGTAAVWTTSVLFFQVLLTGGYAYVHLLTTALKPRAQILGHLALMAAVFLLLPITLREPGPAPLTGTPVFWLLGVLALTAGLPFIVVSSTSPLLQRWLALSDHSLATDPYPLYQASNLGSLVALLAYPALFELKFGILAQQRLWVIGYLALFGLAVACAGHLWRARAVVADAVGELVAGTDVTWLRRGRWILLALVPSTWMLGVTAYFTTAIRPLPLLWVVPLAIYVLSFALVFGKKRLPQALLHRAFPFLAIPLLGFTVLGGGGPFWFLAVFHLGTFLVGALICHGLLAGDRPGTDHLTEFYVWISVGGALGGALAAIAAPLLFNDYFEYPLAIVAACYLRPGPAPAWSRRSVLADTAAACALLAVLLILAGIGTVTGLLGATERMQLSSGATVADFARILLVLAIPAVVAIAFSARPVRFGGAALTVFLVGLLPIGTHGAVLFQVRDFYGLHAVVSDPAGTRHLLVDGITIHGVQINDPASRDIPSAYYSPSGPAGDVFDVNREASANWRVGVIGLGSGALSCYSQPGQKWTYYELDLAIERIAGDPRLFTYLHDCPGGGTNVVIGDGRLALQADRSARFDLLVIDAFGSDAVPTHLLTTQAIELYVSRLNPGGLLLFNVSNRYLNLSSVLAGAAAALGLQALERVDTKVSDEQARAGKFPSNWLVLAARGTSLDDLAARGGWIRPTVNAGQAWTDDYSNVLIVSRFS